jgi:hypothetical protein
MLSLLSDYITVNLESLLAEGSRYGMTDNQNAWIVVASRLEGVARSYHQTYAGGRLCSNYVQTGTNYVLGFQAATSTVLSAGLGL